MSCQNNLKQIGLGMHNYHDAIMELPSGYLYSGGNGKTNYGWAVLILPYIKQGPFSNQLNPIQVPLYKRYKSSATPTDIALLQQTFKIYRCPADTGPPLATDLSFGSEPISRLPCRTTLAAPGGATRHRTRSRTAIAAACFGATAD